MYDIMDEALFSVLIANYNNGKYLQKAIDSVYAQTYTNWEIILVDDGSTDNSQDIYNELKKDSRIHIFYNEGNMGCGYTKRRCAELANGELCGFLDADDVLLPKAIELMVQVHSKNESVSIVYSRCYRCNDRDEVIGQNKLLNLKDGETFFDYREYGAMNFVAYKKSCYDKTEGISAKLQAGVDQDLYFKVEEVGKIFVLDEFTYKYYNRKEGSQLTSYKNVINLYFWNLEVRRATCIRRNLDIDTVLLEDYNSLFLPIIEQSLKYEYNYNSIAKSSAYRLGRFILKPIYWLKKIKKGNDR